MDLGLPKALTTLKVQAFGSGFICFWQTRIDIMMNVDISARYFSAEGAALSAVSSGP